MKFESRSRDGCVGWKLAEKWRQLRTDISEEERDTLVVSLVISCPDGARLSRTPEIGGGQAREAAEADRALEDDDDPSHEQTDLETDQNIANFFRHYFGDIDPPPSDPVIPDPAKPLPSLPLVPPPVWHVPPPPGAGGVSGAGGAGGGAGAGGNAP
ncbi:hypothetical protein GGTG_02592 [Gaeumannomyces tritici R3-111a-1]|uniref:Uncharacterized protein n=1 Tax=Gaeumannomyces tritici (strain R3-111a-1) TaxID=644352 RepID=J3NMT2_GAET3|nr:hypothetical protein GGTG_02592 [Gaeumannomyces tritici R3-111a-1]EJT77483.1 hypothetical protein GGTG_02592 [Gaeumannomyces tritici R3-111a-1]